MQAQQALDPKIRRKNRMILLALVLVFVGPVVLAYGALYLNWFQAGVTNRGGLLQPAPNWSALALRDEAGRAYGETDYRGRWRLLYVQGGECAAACEHNLYTLRQIWTALGKEQDRVAPVFLSLGAGGDFARAAVVKRAFPELAWARGPVPAPELGARLRFDAGDARGRLYIVDPSGLVPLVYELSEQPADTLRIGQDVLKDLKHLLKLSNLG